MTPDQIALFSLFGVVFAMLLWGRIRYDLVAFGALIIAIMTGLVPKDQAFSGFAHPATIIVALVLIISRGLVLSGAVEKITSLVVDKDRSVQSHVTIIGAAGGLMSAIMNNVAALALLMPVDIQAAQKSKRSPSLTLMPLAFATILGGMITLIGTPPNIIIAAFREKSLGEPFAMFDFAPVGLVSSIVGIAFIALVGWRLIPNANNRRDETEALFDIGKYIAEVVVQEDSPANGQRVEELDPLAEEHDIAILGIIRNGRRLAGNGRLTELRANDILVLEATPDAIDKFVGAGKLGYQQKKTETAAAGKGMKLVECVVPDDARIAGRAAMELRLLSRKNVTLLGIARQGKRVYQRVRKEKIQPGDVLLLLGRSGQMSDVVKWLGCLPLASRGLTLTQHGRAGLAAGLFALAILAASLNLIYLPIALAGVVALYALLSIVPARDVYESVEWPVVVLLGSMLPLGAALEASGGTQLIAHSIVDLTEGYSPIVVLTILMVVTMSLSDILNNTATAVVAAPIALEIANKLNVNPDAFLMAVAVAASCAFLTPIGHKNNTLIMGPGGYKFGDYWRMGLPLEILIIAISVPALAFFWPL
ncbi:SLC13 family permease [Cohaesibacter gelatinilyticus]|uniref:Di- and tricarboxylate transporter n=1 Tax=Cohaesibacter gelatinilyticus TaxID=372072 RepID=A0A285PGF8_9HYPH|nr:SLC13 family permease [Cohaesibacter gelatinilyticus]SNZ20792.1 Di- and tricarboxylate transporter [Cohaesibacter gelatinilyticus]